MGKLMHGLTLGAGVMAVSFLSPDDGKTEMPDFSGAKLWETAAPENQPKQEKRADIEGPFVKAIGLVVSAIYTAKGKADALVNEKATAHSQASKVEHLRAVLVDLNKKMDASKRQNQQKLITDLQVLTNSINKSVAKMLPNALVSGDIKNRDELREEMVALSRKIQILFGHRRIQKSTNPDEIVDAFTRWELENRLHKQLEEDKASQSRKK